LQTHVNVDTILVGGAHNYSVSRACIAG